MSSGMHGLYSHVPRHAVSQGRVRGSAALHARSCGAVARRSSLVVVVAVWAGGGWREALDVAYEEALRHVLGTSTSPTVLTEVGAALD